MLPISQFTVVVDPTAAVAAVPRDPTMAVSIYWTAVPISCSSMVGQAREKTVGSSAQFSKLFPEDAVLIFDHSTFELPQGKGDYASSIWLRSREETASANWVMDRIRVMCWP